MLLTRRFKVGNKFKVAVYFLKYYGMTPTKTTIEVFDTMSEAREYIIGLNKLSIMSIKL